jgi:hypothetical protein
MFLHRLKRKKYPAAIAKMRWKRVSNAVPTAVRSNPSMGVKQSLIWTVSAIVVLYAIGAVMHYLKQ